jgi:hypothetical protein
VTDVNSSNMRDLPALSVLPYSAAYFFVISRRAAIDNPSLIGQGNTRPHADIFT